MTQKVINTKGDWVETLIKERKDIKLAVSDEEIAKMSKNKFKVIVDIAIEAKPLENLNATANSHSKSKKIVKNKLACEPYFLDKQLHKSEIELLFALRTRMINIKKNFPSQYKDDLACELCKVHVESQEHLLKCKVLKKHVNFPVDVDHEAMFKNIEKQYGLL